MEDTSLYVIWAKSTSQFGSDILSNDSGVVNNRPDSEPTLQMTTPEPIDNNLSVTGSGNDGLSQVPPQNQDKESLNVSVPGENPTHQCSNRSQEDIQFQSTMSPKAIEPISNYAPVTEDEMAAIIDPIQDSIDPVTSLKHNPKSNSNSKLLTMEHPTTNNNIFESVSTPKIPNEVSSETLLYRDLPRYNYASKNTLDAALGIIVPSPFKRNLFWPENEHNKKKTRIKRKNTIGKMDVPLMKLNTSKSVAGPKISLECYVIVLYEGEYFPGKVENVNEKQYEVSTMTLSTGNSFRWPEKPDKIWYKVIKKTDEPVCINKRDRHVVPNKISKMKVKCATQVISRSVAANMGYLASMGILPKECQETADLLLFFDNVFESVNGSYGNSKKGLGSLCLDQLLQIHHIKKCGPKQRK
ncbi:hypothetical protein HW555_013898 [Spodoptera exigua]|uniref:Transposable element P transposase-like GTP-binding insertion domain-containing protein n=1 Tax=Spodoptera exigua TaxID=7107 RepID=A0A835G463_SPOEX|nr:hypothetical protein HW555_013898 [Spodoptera exigua]